MLLVFALSYVQLRWTSFANHGLLITFYSPSLMLGALAVNDVAREVESAFDITLALLPVAGGITFATQHVSDLHLYHLPPFDLLSLS
jgi:hypothetical protein